MGALIWIFYCYFQGIIHFCTKTSPFSATPVSNWNHLTEEFLLHPELHDLWKHAMTLQIYLKCEACEMYVENLVYVKELVRLISCPNHLRVQVKTSLSLCGKNDIADRR